MLPFKRLRENSNGSITREQHPRAGTVVVSARSVGLGDGCGNGDGTGVALSSSRGSVPQKGRAVFPELSSFVIHGGAVLRTSGRVAARAADIIKQVALDWPALRAHADTAAFFKASMDNGFMLQTNLELEERAMATHNMPFSPPRSRERDPLSALSLSPLEPLSSYVLSPLRVPPPADSSTATRAQTATTTVPVAASPEVPVHPLPPHSASLAQPEIALLLKPSGPTTTVAKPSISKGWTLSAAPRRKVIFSYLCSMACFPHLFIQDQ